MTLTHSLTLPAACRPLSPAEADAVLGGADTATDEGSFTTVLSNIEKVSKVFNYMARIFSSTSAMLNNFITIQKKTASILLGSSTDSTYRRSSSTAV